MSQEPVNITTFPFGQPFTLVKDPFRVVHYRLLYPYEPPFKDAVLTYIPVINDDFRPPEFVPIWVNGDSMVIPSGPPAPEDVSRPRQM